MVAHKDVVQDAKVIAQKLRADGRSEWELHREVYRPWGKYTNLFEGQGFLMKELHVKSKGLLSLQKHHHRSEHWVVVEGTVRVIIDDETKLLTEGQSVYIPLGTVHRMENPGKVPMILIEVQTGTYLGEDDIIRYEDIYARK